MRNSSIKVFVIAAMLTVGVVPAFSPVWASSLDTDRSVFGSSGGTISPTVTNSTEDSGDRYVAAKTPDGTLFFHTEDGSWTTTATPFAANQVFSGSTTLFQADSQAISAGSYQIFEVVTDAGADVFDTSLWHGNVNKINVTTGQPATVSQDFNDDGWPDDDANHDGFHDDDLNEDGFHDDDLNKDGYHEADADHDGYSDDDHDHDGFHDGDTNHDGFDDGDTNHDGTVDTEDN